MRKAFFLAFLLLPQLALAKPSEEDKLFSDLAKAESPEDAHPIEGKIATLFKVSGSPTVDLLMSRANAALSATDNGTARKLVEAVTRVAPNYAEGWHQRAQMQAAANDDAGAMLSLQKVVEINPRQFSAMAELAEMMEAYGDKPGALKLYRRVLALDPQMDAAAHREKALSKEMEGQGI